MPERNICGRMWVQRYMARENHPIWLPNLLGRERKRENGGYCLLDHPIKRVLSFQGNQFKEQDLPQIIGWV